MATERQIEANRKNAARSSGPKTEQGKSASRLNATRHGMASASPAVEAHQSPEFQARRDGWAENYSPANDFEDWSLDRAVAASFRIERCEKAMEGLEESISERARLSWEQDRALDAAKLGDRLGKNPSLIARKLESTWHGVALMIQWWLCLGEALTAAEDWSEAQAATALDLLGVPLHFRTGRTLIDGPGDSRTFRQTLVTNEIDRLEQLQNQVLSPIDEIDRDLAISGDTLILNPSAKLILRYEREAWRRYRESVKVLTAPKPESDQKPESATIPTPTRRPPIEADARSIHESMMRQARVGMAGMIRELGLEESPEELDEFFAEFETPGTNPIGVEVGLGGLGLAPAITESSSGRK